MASCSPYFSASFTIWLACGFEFTAFITRFSLLKLKNLQLLNYGIVTAAWNFSSCPL